MTEIEHRNKDSRRDILVSLAIIAENGIGSLLDSVELQVQKITNTYLFTEILIINNNADVSAKTLIDRLTIKGAQCRVIEFDRKLNFDQLATLGYQESIGDIVVVASIDEIKITPLDLLVDEIYKGRDLVRLKRVKSSIGEKFISKCLVLLTGLDIDTRFMRTMAMSRKLLTDLLPRDELISFFRFYSSRFEPNQEIVEIDTPVLRRGKKILLERIWTLAKLISMSASRLLRIVAAFSAMLAILSLFWLTYVISIFFFKPDVAEGWVSLSIVIGTGSLIQTAAATVVCLGLARLLDDKKLRNTYRMVSDLTGSDLFKDFSQLNVKSLRK